MTTMHPHDVHTDIPASAEASAPPTTDDVPPQSTTPARRRRRTILAILLGVLVLAVPVTVLALVTGSGGSPDTVAPAPNPPSANGVPSATGPGQPPATNRAGSPTSAGLPTRYQPVRLSRLSETVDPNLANGAFALNDRGQVVGQSVASNGRVHPVLWQNGHVIDLGVLAQGPDEMGIARDINSRGDVVGGSEGPNGQRAVLWRNGSLIDLGTLTGDTRSFAYAINDLGQIVGTSTTPTGAHRGFLWENGHMRDLGIDPGVAGLTIPWDINDHGRVVGTAGLTDSGLGKAFAWQDGTVTWLVSPGQWSSARVINNRGEILGGYTVDVGSHAVRWYEGAVTELGPLPGGDSTAAAAINEHGQILGSSNMVSHSIDVHPVLWAQGRVYDLTAAGIPANVGYYVTDINERGQILAGSSLFNPA